MLAKAYLDVVRRLADQLEAGELAHIDQIAEQAAKAVEAGQVIHLYDHGHMLNHELFDRAGGLALLDRIAPVRPSLPAKAVRPPAGRDLPRPTWDLGLDRVFARFVVLQSDMRAGDLLFIASAAGRAPFLVDLALAAREAGVHTIGLIAMRYAQALPPSHPSGQLLHHVVDDVIDLQTSEGDAELSLEGLDERIGPASGIMGALIGWMVVVGLAEALVARGVVPTVFRSVQYPDGPARLEAARQRYQTLGY